jgi:3-oxoacyl-[acyl-carrier protein] reductase
MTARFEGRVAVNTGGSSGIGATIARRLAEEGATVLVVASRDAAKAAEVARAIAAAGGRAEGVAADVRDADAVRALADGIVAFHGRIDIWVNAAGLFLPSPPGETDTSVLDLMIDTNVKGTWNGVQAVVPHMKRAGGGKILNFSSVAGLTAFKGFALYSASKAATAMMTRVLAAELAPFDINVNAIAPGNTATPMNEGMRSDPAQAAILEAMQAMTPSNRTFSDPDEIAAAALFLLSDAARPIHGSTLLVDEGISAALG